MWEFIVLGNIPGTSVQVTFETWLYIVGVAVWLAVVVWCMRQRMLFAAWRIARIMEQEIKTASAGPARQALILPLPA